MVLDEVYEIQLLGEWRAVGLYSIRNISGPHSEFYKFMLNHKTNPEISDDYFRIIKWISKIGELGALERYFRPESKMDDNVWAIPIESGSLRLYVIRISDEILILGNGGIKQTETYNEDPFLNRCVVVLAEIDRKIKNKLKAGLLQVESRDLQGIDKVKFHIKPFDHE